MEDNADSALSRRSDGDTEKDKGGFQVVVEDPKFIYGCLPLFDWDEYLTLQIQKDDIGDSLVSSLTTGIDFNSSMSPESPNAYNLRSEIHVDGKNASISKFNGGYMSLDEVTRFTQLLKEHGYRDAELGSNTNMQTISLGKDGYDFLIDLGWSDERSKQEWLDKNAKNNRQSFDYWEKYAGRGNRNIRLITIINNTEDRSSDSAQNFSEDVQEYSQVYQAMLKSFYKVHNVPEPEKTLRLRYDSAIGTHLKMVK